MSTLNAFGFTTRKHQSRVINPSTSFLGSVQQTPAFVDPATASLFKPSTLINTSITNSKEKKLTSDLQPKSKSLPKNTKKPATNNQKKNDHNVITRYFTPMMTQLDVEMEELTTPLPKESPAENEEVFVCIVRKKLPLYNLLQEFESEYDMEEENLIQQQPHEASCFDTFLQSDWQYKEQLQQQVAPSRGTRRRRSSDTQDQYELDTATTGKYIIPCYSLLKRQKTIDTELSQVMTQFLKLQPNTLIRTNKNSSPNYHLQAILHELEESATEEKENLSRPMRSKMSIQESQLFVHGIAQEFISLF